MANSVDLDEVAHLEPSYQDLGLFANSAIFVSGTYTVKHFNQNLMQNAMPSQLLMLMPQLLQMSS